MNTWIFLTIAALILVNALYVAAEFAVVGARPSRVEALAAEGSRLAKAVLPIVRETHLLDNYIAACQIGITVSSLVLGAFGQATVGLALAGTLQQVTGLDPVPALGLASVIVLLVLTSTQVVIGELVPKTVALQFPVRTAMYTHPPMRWSLIVFTPFIRLLNGSGAAVLRLLGAEHSKGHHHVHSPEELEMLLRESAEGGEFKPEDSERLRAGLRLAKRTARQLMVPRRDIVGLNMDLPADDLFKAVRTSPYTRLIAYRGDLDEVLGVLHIKDVAAYLADTGAVESLEDRLRPVLRLPGSLSAERVLTKLREHRARLALVVREFGDVEGLITLQDLVSEMLGEIDDEFKHIEVESPVALPDGRWRVGGHFPAEEFIEWAGTLGVAALPEQGDAETLSGLIMHALDAVPAAGQSLQLGGLALTVERMHGAAVQSVVVESPATGAERRHD